MNSPDKIIIVDRFAPLRGPFAHATCGTWRRRLGAPYGCPAWSVKDVAAHLLGGDIAILSGKRDGFRPAQKIDSYDQLVELVNRLNCPWVLAARRLSPRLLRELRIPTM